MAKQHVVFLGTGGTIAGRAQSGDDNVSYQAAQIGLAGLLEDLPALGRVLGDTEALIEQVAQLDSKDMGFAVWATLAQRVSHYLSQDSVQGVVITHGTDTLEETAFFLSQVVPAELLQAKPVVLTCAMRPASSLAPDGPQNVLDATTVCLSGSAHGVLAVCAGRVHSAHAVQKVHPYRLDAFDSGESGPVGVVEEGVYRPLSGVPAGPHRALAIDEAKLRASPWPRVEIVMNYAGATGATVRALCEPAEGVPRVEGLVLAGTGNGTLHQDLIQALQQAQDAGVQVWVSTRCAIGSVIPPVHVAPLFHYAVGLSPVKARIALTLKLLAKR